MFNLLWDTRPLSLSILWLTQLIVYLFLVCRLVVLSLPHLRGFPFVEASTISHSTPDKSLLYYILLSSLRSWRRSQEVEEWPPHATHSTRRHLYDTQSLLRTRKISSFFFSSSNISNPTHISLVGPLRVPVGSPPKRLEMVPSWLFYALLLSYFRVLTPFLYYFR